MALTFAILGAAVISRQRVLIEFLPIAVPSIALITTLIFTAHEFLIGLLSAHLVDIALESGGVPEWDWHGGDKYVRKIFQRRGFMYVAHIIAVSILCFLAFVLSATLSGRSFQAEWPATWKVGAGIALSAIILTVGIYVWRIATVLGEMRRARQQAEEGRVTPPGRPPQPA